MGAPATDCVLSALVVTCPTYKPRTLSKYKSMGSRSMNVRGLPAVLVGLDIAPSRSIGDISSHWSSGKQNGFQPLGTTSLNYNSERVFGFWRRPLLSIISMCSGLVLLRLGKLEILGEPVHGGNEN
jgi:hypothetical protein